MLRFWVKFSDDILKHFFLFFQENRFDFSCKLSQMETISMECQILFSGESGDNFHEMSKPVCSEKIRKNIINLLSAELTGRVKG